MLAQSIINAWCQKQQSSNNIQYLLNQRFSFATNIKVHELDAIYISSTLLEPAYQKIVNNMQEKKPREFILVNNMRKGSDSEVEQK